MQSMPSPVARYGIGVITVAAAQLILLALRPLFITNILSLFLVAVTVSALYGGVGPALLSTILSAASASYFLLAPTQFQVGDGIRLLFMIGSALFIILIAERRSRAERAVAASEERYRSLIESATDYAIFLVDREGHVGSWNAGAEHLLGYRSSEILGQHVARFFTAEDVAADTPRRELAHALIEDRSSGTGECVRKDGSRFWAEDSVRAIRMAGGAVRGFHFVLHDITERQRAEEILAQHARDEAEHAAQEALQRREELFRSLIENTSDMLMIVADDGTVVYQSPSCERILGYEPATAVGQSGLEFIHPDDRAEAAQILADATQNPGVVYSGEFRLRHRDGSWRTVEALGKRLPPAAGVSGLVINSRDITARKDAEEALRRAHEEMEQRVEERTAELTAANAALQNEIAERKRVEVEREALLAQAQEDRKRAEEANRAKDEFLAVVSHELRTPLTPLLTWTRLLRSGKLDATGSVRALEGIERSVKAQVQLIEDLLDVSRIVAGKFRLNVREVHLESVIEAAVDSVRPAAEAKRIHLQLTAQPVGMIRGDGERLKQVVWNLLSNAIKFTPEGGRVDLLLECADTRARIIVRDTGQGISPDFMPYIFDRFRQADSSSVRAHGGLGLGLAIVRHLVDLHGGTVRAASDGPGQGAVFTVEVPLDSQRAARPPHAQPTTGATFEFGTLSGTRVLVVDDELDTLETLSVVLSQCGAEVRTAASATEALAILQEWRADLLVSDIGLPEEDGYSLMSKIRMLPPTKGGDIPALALTAYARPEDRLQVLSAGFQMHMSKPIEPAELVSAIAMLRESASDRRRARG